MTFQQGEKGIHDCCTDSDCNGISQTLHPDFDRARLESAVLSSVKGLGENHKLWVIDSAVCQWCKVDHGVEVHSRDKGHAEGDGNNALTSKEILRHHGILGEFPFPHDKGSYECRPDEQHAQDVCADPWMSRAARLEGNETRHS